MFATYLGRIEEDKFVLDSRRALAEGITVESHNRKHERIFRQFILPRQRKYGSNPGAPSSWSGDGSYFDVDRKTIRSITFPSKDRAEVETDWGYMLPGGRLMFVLTRIDGDWLIDSLKVENGAGWEVAHL